jgi:hypothetical protein
MWTAEAVVLDNCAELYLSENSSRLESDLNSSLTCGGQRYNSEQTSSYRQWCIPRSHRSSIFLHQMPLFTKINQESHVHFICKGTYNAHKTYFGKLMYIYDF